ncbi:right-handed parallel beta-helix repeat-containing protein [Desulfogranum mediterraneum]|uniref:hypothetical protein n=1 Tax=Desulfogranum mediterraneum TaxID=160661 RepID=UPI0004219E8C|nr:hypothetical protein [Desulfogranum mediterraneum]
MHLQRFILFSKPNISTTFNTITPHIIRYHFILLCILAISSTVLHPALTLAEGIDLPKDSDGWTIFSPSDDSRIIYVAADGNDTTGTIYNNNDKAIGYNPLNPIGPINAFASYAAAERHLRSGYPDWLLFKRGDLFSSNTINLKDGRSATEPSLIAAYGTTGASPIIKTGKNIALRRCCKSFSWIAVSGIEFYANTRDPDSAEYINGTGNSGISIYIAGDGNYTGEGLLIEGCKFSFFTNNVITAYDNTTGITLRRNAILDNYNDSAHAQGLYTHGASVLLEENIFDHNGWYSRAGSGGIGQATVFNHNTYFANSKNTTFSENIFLRPSSINNKWTANNGASSAANIVMDNNLYIDGEVGISAGGNKTEGLRFANIAIRNNVLINIGRSRPTNRTLAWGIDTQDWNGGSIVNNYLINQPLDTITNTYGILVSGKLKNVQIANNVIHDMRHARGLILDDSRGTDVSNMSFTNNKIQIDRDASYTINAEYAPAGKWVFSDNTYYSSRTEGTRYRIDGADKTLAEWQAETGDNSTFTNWLFSSPSRSLESYQATIGNTPSIEAFISACRAQNRYNWDPRYSAKAVNTWIKAGFYKFQPPSNFKLTLSQ